MKFNWLVFLILDGICGSVLLSYLYSILWGTIREGKFKEHNGWIINIICILIPLIFHLCINPFFYYFVDECGIGASGNIGFVRWKFFKGFKNFKKWSEINHIDFVSSPIINSLFIDANTKKGVTIDFRFLTNKKKGIEILLKNLPRDKATLSAEKKFFERWERKLTKEKFKND